MIISLKNNIKTIKKNYIAKQIFQKMLLFSKMIKYQNMIKIKMNPHKITKILINNYNFINNNN